MSYIFLILLINNCNTSNIFANNKKEQMIKWLSTTIPVLSVYIKNKIYSIYAKKTNIISPETSIKSRQTNKTPYIYIIYTICILLIIYKICSIYMKYYSVNNFTNNTIINIKENNNHVILATKPTNVIINLVKQIIDNTLNLDIVYTFDPLIISIFYTENMWILGLKIILLMYRYKYIQPNIKNLRFFGDVFTQKYEDNYCNNVTNMYITSPIYITNIITLVLDIYMRYLSNIQIILSLINSNIIAFLTSFFYKINSKIVYKNKYFFLTDKEIALFLIKIGIITCLYPYGFFINIFLINIDYMIFGIILLKNILNNKYMTNKKGDSAYDKNNELLINTSSKFIILLIYILNIMSNLLTKTVLLVNNNHIMCNYISSNINYDDLQRA